MSRLRILLLSVALLAPAEAGAATKAFLDALSRLPAQMTNPQGLPEMFGLWRIVGVFCDCHGTKNPEIGWTINVQPHSFNDPFSIECKGLASYPSRKLAWKDAVVLFYVNMTESEKNLRPSQTQVLDTEVDCNGDTYAHVMFLGNDQMIYRYYSENYLLTREPAAK